METLKKMRITTQHGTGFCEGRIKDIEAKLSHAQVIDVTQIENTGKVIFGTVTSLI